jgi:hypothetical protein
VTGQTKDQAAESGSKLDGAGQGQGRCQGSLREDQGRR